MTKMNRCGRCSAENYPDAKFCQQCGAPLEPKNRPEQILDPIKQALANTIDALRPPKPQPEKIRQSPQRRHQADAKPRPSMIPKKPGELIRGYQVLETRSQTYSNYYKTRLLKCTCGHQNPPSGNDVCEQCRTPLRQFVLRETFVKKPLGQKHKNLFMRFSQEIEGILNSLEIFFEGNKQYVVLDNFPEPWSILANTALPVGNPDTAIAWVSQLGKAIQQTHQRQYALSNVAQQQYWLESIIILKNQQAYFSDLTMSRPITNTKASPVQKNIWLLAKILYIMLTGSKRMAAGKNVPAYEVPHPYREAITMAREGKFASVDAFLTALQNPPARPELTRSLRQLVGYGTDVGKQREHNEDYVSKFSLGLEQVPGTPEVGLYIVADGMGGHQAGEKASEAVIKDVVINRIQEQLHNLKSVPKLKRATVKLDDLVTPGEILREAIEQANAVLYKARNAASGSDRGTTITATLIVGSTCAIANVGDSRTYLMRNNTLQQITKDHSLVASLVASGMISENEVRTHPQRNQIYRTLGDKPKVEVDVFQKVLIPGDRLLLCSDGLWEMVLDDTIAAILHSARTPQSACDRLIEAANQAGGEDNISVIVIWIE